jgi:hypothetical protein
LIQRDLGIVGDDFCDFAYGERDRAVVVAGLQIGNHVAANVANLTVRENPFEPIANLDKSFVVVDREQNQNATINAFGPDFHLVV